METNHPRERGADPEIKFHSKSLTMNRPPSRLVLLGAVAFSCLFLPADILVTATTEKRFPCSGMCAGCAILGGIPSLSEPTALRVQHGQQYPLASLLRRLQVA